MMEHLADPGAILVADPTGFPKKRRGQASRSDRCGPTGTAGDHLAGDAASQRWLRSVLSKIAVAVARPYRSTVRRAASSLGLSIGLALLAVITAAGVVFVLGWATLGHLLYATDPETHRRGLDVGHLLDSVKIGLAVVAGLGAAVGLTVSYRKQRGEEDKAFTDRFTATADQLGHGKAAVRLAGVYALARLADDWEPHRQTCIDVLCAYLRMPYDPESPEPGEREVRLTVIRLIRDHLRPTARVSWSGRDLDFTGTVFDGGDFSGATFSGGTVNFSGATFSGGTVDLSKPLDWSVPPSDLPPSAPGLLLPEGRGAVSD